MFSMFFLSDLFFYLFICIAAFLLHGAVGICLFLWVPNKDQSYVFYIFVGMWAVGYSVYTSVLSREYFRFLYFACE